MEAVYPEKGWAEDTELSPSGYEVKIDASGLRCGEQPGNIRAFDGRQRECRHQASGWGLRVLPRMGTRREG